MYNGYRIKINGIIVSDNFISEGSYSAQKVKRVLDEYHDAYGVEHEFISPHKPVEISFSIRERSMAEQAKLSALFNQYENVPVEYWDDVKCEYKSGNFKMEQPTFSHANTRGGSIKYKKTNIKLMEY